MVCGKYEVHSVRKTADGKHGGYAWKYNGRRWKAVIAGRPRFHVFAAPFFVDGESKLALLEQLIRRHTMLANSMKLRQQPVMFRSSIPAACIISISQILPKFFYVFIGIYS